jgi:hypothetical protein
MLLLLLPLLLLPLLSLLLCSCAEGKSHVGCPT